ncbi:LPXTG cell wall anchor domain-containing protein [Vagococcus salmoninarum]
MPQTGSQKTMLPILIGGALLITSSVVVLERRESYEVTLRRNS